MIALLLACRPPATPEGAATATVTGQAMGGDLRIVVRCPSTREHAACLDEGLTARAEIERIESLATDWRPPGEIATLDAAAGLLPVKTSPEVHELLVAAKRVAEATHGAFDPTIGALWGLWDFEAGHRPSDAAIAEALPLVDWHRLEVLDDQAYLEKKGMAVTLGGIAQGYAAAKALAKTPREALVDVSGDIAVRGAWPVELQHPRKERGTSFASLTLVDAVLTTSGDYEKFFLEDGVRYHHLLDPRTGQPARGAISATVVSTDGSIADALTKALFVLGPDAATVDRLGAWALVVDPKGAVHVLGDAHGHVRDLQAPSEIEVTP